MMGVWGVDVTNTVEISVFNIIHDQIPRVLGSLYNNKYFHKKQKRSTAGIRWWSLIVI